MAFQGEEVPSAGPAQPEDEPVLEDEQASSGELLLLDGRAPSDEPVRDDRAPSDEPVRDDMAPSDEPVPDERAPSDERVGDGMAPSDALEGASNVPDARWGVGWAWG